MIKYTCRNKGYSECNSINRACLNTYNDRMPIDTPHPQDTTQREMLKLALWQAAQANWKRVSEAAQGLLELGEKKSDTDDAARGLIMLSRTNVAEVRAQFAKAFPTINPAPNVQATADGASQAELEDLAETLSVVEEVLSEHSGA
jgi:hypothetical protein